ncbi:hypothetical protein GCM10009821_20390 [Aeromicrobium halocynthiae]|uniref:DUF4352 domain-containing protein n=1 Tax=Aeromicrobium halocynthiae TaxID=560557 RepID=A0ABN2W0R6_9ACTN
MNDTTQQAPENPRAAAKAAKAYAKASRPWYRKKRWIAAIVIGVLVLFAAVSGGGEEGATRADTSEVAAGGSAGDEGDAEEVTQDAPVAVGEAVELEGTRYVVESVRTSPTVGSEFFEEQANGIYVIVDLTIENLKDETKVFSDTAAVFRANNDKSYSTDSDGTFAALGDDGEPLIFEEMQPDLPKTGLLVFDVPESVVAGGLLEVSDLFGRGEAFIDLGL